MIPHMLVTEPTLNVFQDEVLEGAEGQFLISTAALCFLNMGFC